MFLIVAALILVYAAWQVWGPTPAIAVAVASSVIGLLIFVYAEDD